jgi:hypothetical protein
VHICTLVLLNHSGPGPQMHMTTGGTQTHMHVGSLESFRAADAYALLLGAVLFSPASSTLLHAGERKTTLALRGVYNYRYVSVI